MLTCSTAFEGLGRAQAKALGANDLPMIVVPHPFGSRTRDEIRAIARSCTEELERLIRHDGARISHEGVVSTMDPSALHIVAPVEQCEFDAFCREHAWSDGLPLVRPTPHRVQRVLQGTVRKPGEVVATMPPGFGVATVERIAINAVMAGCAPEFLPVLIAAVEAACQPDFNLQGVQATTHPATPWLIVNGPIAATLAMNGGVNCLGPGNWANATIGRAFRLVLQNIGGAVSGAMDRATQGQPGKYSFCCAENDAASPWEPLHVERGYAASASTVTVVAVGGTLNMNSHSKDADDLLAVLSDTLANPTSNDYWYAGAPFVILAPEHAEVLHRAGLSKAEVKRRVWGQSKLSASRLSARDYTRPEHARASEFQLRRDSLIPIAKSPEDIGVIVAGGPGTHSVYVPGYGNSRPVTQEIV